MSKPRILIAEDEESIAKTLALNLSMENYEVLLASTGSMAMKLFENAGGALDLVLLDIMLPDMDGFELCRKMKRLSPAIPVIFLTARNQQPDRVKGLRLGADDYITKPFDLEELLLRVSNVLKRSAPVSDSFSFEHGSINFETFEITDVHGRTHVLSKREIGLLKLLTSNSGKVVSRDEIIERLWESDENASTRTIDNYILGFRKYFEPSPRNPLHFHSVRGVGYRFT